MQVEEHVEHPEHLFTEEDIFQYEDASTGQRFLNYLIDALLMQYGLGLATGYLLAKILISLAPDLAYSLFIEEGTFSFLLLNYLLSMFNYLIYYTFCEKAFRGYTLGKLITGTRAIRQDGKELSFKIRSCAAFPAWCHWSHLAFGVEMVFGTTDGQKQW